MLGSIRNAYTVFQEHDFSRENQFRILSIYGAPDYVAKELLDKPEGEGGVYYLQSASVPGRTISDIPHEYHGFTFHIPGMVAYSNPNPWSLTFTTPGDYLVRNALEAWHFSIFSDETSCGNFQIPCEGTIIRIGLVDRKCRIIRAYDLVGIYPQDIGEIQYNIQSTNTTTFTVAFHYQYWRPVANFDSGRMDSTTVENTIIQGTYASYHSDILQNEKECATIPVR